MSSLNLKRFTLVICGIVILLIINTTWAGASPETVTVGTGVVGGGPQVETFHVTIPSAKRPYSIYVEYKIWFSGFNNFPLGWHLPYYWITGGDQPVGTILASHNKDSTFSGSFNVAPNENATIYAYTGQAWDWLNNYWSSYLSITATYYLDATPPDIPGRPWVEDLQDGGVYSPDTATTYTRYNPVTIQWTQPNDNGTNYNGHFTGPGGVTSYMIFNGNNPVTGWITGTQYSMELNNNTTYTLRLKARDYDNNISDYGLTRTVIADRTPPSGSLAIQGTDPNNRYTNSANITLSVTNIKDINGSGIDKIRFGNANNEKDYSAWEPCNSGSFTKYNWQLPGGDGPKTVYAQLKDKVGNIATLQQSIILDTTPPQNGMLVINDGEPYTHDSNVSLTLSASDSSGVTGMRFSNNGKDFSTPEPYSPGPRNWPLDFSDEGDKTVYVQFQDGAGNWTTQEIKATIFYDNTPPNGSIVINGGEKYTNNAAVTLRLAVNDSRGAPVSRVRFSNDGSNYSAWEPFTMVKSWRLDRESEPGEKTVFVQFQDIFNQVSTFMGYITLDLIPPQGAFTVASRTGKVLDNGSNPTNSTLVRLANINVSDNQGAAGANSGVKGVCFWNGASDSPPMEAACYALGDLPPGGLDWALAEGFDGERTVTMRVEDNAGNSYLSRYTVTLDTAPPGAATGFKHSYNNGRLEFTWKAAAPDSDLDHFSGTYTLPGGSVIPFQAPASEGKEGRYSINITGAAPNQPVLITVRAVDYAGNQSESQSDTAYTPAALGLLQFLGGGYDPATGRHQLKWQLDSSPGASKTQKLEYGNATPEGFAPLGSIEMDGAGIFIHDSLPGGLKLAPHGTYHYRLVAYNNSDDPTYGAVFAQQAPNLAPSQPAALGPLGFARGEVEFTYQPAVDYDGDPLIYRIYLGVSPNPGSFNELSSESASGLIAGQTYYWYVQARDAYGGSANSNIERFTVDNAAPSLSATEPGRPFSSQNSLTVTAGDDLSGIDRITYQKISATTNQVLDEGNVALAPSGSGVTGTIPLSEGSYHLQITAWDHAGNTKKLQFNNLWIDQTAPILGNIRLGLLMSQNRYYAGQLMIPVRFSGADNFSGAAGLRYWLAKGPNQGQNNGRLAPLSPNLTDYALTLEAPGVSGEEYYLGLELEDRAGNRSEIAYVGPILVDLTPPQASLALEGLRQYNSGFYSAGLNEISAHPVASDPESGVSEIKLSIVDTGSGALIAPWSGWTALKTASLIPGHNYRVAVKVANQAGLTTLAQSEEFTYDNTPPQVSIDGPSGRLAGGETICLNLAATDPETAVTGYRVALIAYNDPEQALPIAGGDAAGWLWISGGGNSTQIRLELPAGVDGIYYPAVLAQNAAGLTATRTGAAFILDNTQEKVMVADQGPYTMFADHLSGWWRLAGAKPVNDYRYRIVTTAGAVVKDWQVTTGTSVTVTGLSLSHGAGYRFEVQARYSDGTYSEPGLSPGITVDLTQPELTGLQAPRYCTSANLKVQWAGRDPESGVQAYAALGSSFGGADITGGWAALNGAAAILSRDVKGNPLQLITGRRYYITLRLMNGAGLITEEAGAAVTIDDTPPPTPVVLDQGAYLNTKQPLEANWRWSPEDPESGPATYQWALLQYGQDPETADWQEGDPARQVKLAGFAQEHGHTYYFAVRAVNGAGLSSIGVSNGIMIDASAPYLPEVKLLSAVNLGDPEAAEVAYITNNQNLGLWIDSQDPESLVDKYLYAWGQRGAVDANPRLESADGQIRLSNPQIPEGVLTIFAGECANQAQLVSGTGYSGGVMLDTGAPKITGVSGGVSGDRLYFDWEVELSISPVARYEVALVRLEDAGPAVWADNGLERTYIYDAKDLPDGKYYLLVRAVNQAGTVSRREGALDEWGVSPVVALDRAAPVISEFSYSRYASSQLKIQLGAEDNLSGISGYQYALGSKANPLEYSGGWVDLDSQAGKVSHEIPTAGIPQLREAYLMVRAKDRAGLWSAVKTSQAITIDHTLPAKPVVASGPYTTSKQEIGGISFTSGDPDSGITHYRLGVVAEPGGSWLAAQLRPVTEFDGRITGLELSEGGVYYLALQTQNGAGDWSETGYSGPVTADTIGPQLSFTAAGDTIVINQPPYEIEYTLSEAAQVTFTQTGADGTAKQFTVSGQAGINRFLFNESLPRTYQIAAQAVDLAGNPGGNAAQTIRVNAPPRIVLPAEIDGTPGALIQFIANVVDPDGTPGQALSYQWDPGDGSPLLGGSSPKHRYPGLVQDYRLTLTVADPDGGSATATALVKIHNTAQGTLYMNETWQGVHRIYGKVVVPAGVTLAIAPGTEVIVDGTPGGNEADGALVVQGNLEAGTGVSFRANSGLVNSWKGIMIEGSATLTGATIRDAERGLAVVGPAQARVTDCALAGNCVGIHVYGARPLILNCRLQDNLWYGIKEDEAGRPVVIGCRFTGNGIDYYQDELTKITVAELNGIDGNSGNW
ncbi:MAG: Ig-like domain repeat protein [Firmicutes bacterium]|nr:Ig-like domain repeat protein [Bacillota bacterium]